MAENIITQKIGPLPLVIWVAGGAGVVGLFILMSHKGNNGAAANQTNQVSALAPTEAEAFGTIEQQQQDVTNALTTLGNNQSALGGSLSTLTGIVTQQGSDNAAAFQNLVNGQQSIQQGQTAASTQANSFYQSLLQNLQNYYASLHGSIDTVNSNVQNVSSQQNMDYQALYGQAANYYQTLYGQGAGISSQVSGVSGLIQGATGQTQSAIDQLGSFLGWQFYQIPDRYSAYIPTGLNPPGWH